MKRIFTLLSFALLTTATAGAQSFSLGGRMGTSCLWQNTDHKYISFDQSVYGRYETHGRWAFEAGLGHWGGGMGTTVFAGLSDEGADYVDAHAKLNNYELNLSVQYDISCPYMQEHCPVMRRIHTFASLDVSPAWSHTNLLYNDGEDFTKPVTAHKKNAFQLWTGLSETMICSINDHFNLVSNAGFKINPAEIFSASGNNYQPDARLYLQVGAAYRF